MEKDIMSHSQVDGLLHLAWETWYIFLLLDARAFVSLSDPQVRPNIQHSSIPSGTAP